MRTIRLTALAATVAAASLTGCGTGEPARTTAKASATTASTGEVTRVLAFTYRPAVPGEQATTVSIWFTADAGGGLVAMRSRRVAVKTGRLLQETSYRRGATDYSIVDHEACQASDDVQPPTAATADGVIADSIGPLDAKRPLTEINDGQVLMRIAQPTAELSSRVVTLVEVASGQTVATIDGVSLTAAEAGAAQAALQPLRCTPNPSATPSAP